MTKQTNFRDLTDKENIPLGEAMYLVQDWMEKANEGIVVGLPFIVAAYLDEIEYKFKITLIDSETRTFKLVRRTDKRL